MSAHHVGRNDPCPCGSGKKYKRCCLPKEEQQAPANRPLRLPDETPDIEEQANPVPNAPMDVSGKGLPSVTDPRQIPSLLRELARKAPKRDRAMYRSLLAETGPLLEYLERQDDIEAAQEALEAYRPEIEKLLEDQPAYLDRSRKLFAEERFAPLRFTADDVQSAFDQVGLPVNLATTEKAAERLRAAILFLANKDRRQRLGMELMLRLPKLVAEGRPLEAWIVRHCSQLTAEFPDDSNPFLFEMFSAGYGDWVTGRKRRERALLRELGVDPERMERLSWDEVDAWMREQAADPAVAARIEQFLETHPEVRTESIANIEQMERNSIALLERPDASNLFLSAEELEPWLPVLNERLRPLYNLMPVKTDTAPDQATADTILNTLRPLLAEMAAKIFTSERLGRLLEQLRTYRNEHFASGDRRAAGQALGAIAILQRKDDGGRNDFLNALCFTSVGRLLDTMRETTQT